MNSERKGTSAYFSQLLVHRSFIGFNLIQPLDFSLEDLRAKYRQVSLCCGLEGHIYFEPPTLPH